MEVNRLLSSELTYEILIRGYPISATVDEKRAILRRLLRQEREGESCAPTSTTLDTNDELLVCASKLDELERDIKSFSFENRQNEFGSSFPPVSAISTNVEGESQSSATNPVSVTGNSNTSEL